MNTVIFLFGVWFNPTQVVSLSDGYKPFSTPFCYINLNYGEGQSGVSIIKSKYDCKKTAELLNKHTEQ